jgi:hypothetical protein
MEIEITKSGKNYRVDLVDLPGSPPVGIDETVELAIVDLFYQLFNPKADKRWLKYIDWSYYKIIL